jgi:hypothetical protein
MNMYPRYRRNPFRNLSKNKISASKASARDEKSPASRIFLSALPACRFVLARGWVILSMSMALFSGRIAATGPDQAQAVKKMKADS